MRRVFSSSLGVAVAFFVLVAGATFVQTQGGTVKVESPMVSVTYLEHGHEVTKEFDLSDPAQYHQVKEMLEAGHVERIVRQRPINVLALSADLGIWTLVVFGLLFFILKKVAWGPMLEGLRRREETIQGSLTDAQKARDEAKGVRDEVQRRLDQIGEEIRNLMDDARRKAEGLTADLTAKARQEIQADRDRLLREIGLEKDKALKELLDQTAQLATLVSSKTIRRQLNPEDHRRLVDEALVEMRHAGAPNGAPKAVV